MRWITEGRIERLFLSPRESEYVVAVSERKVR